MGPMFLTAEAGASGLTMASVLSTITEVFTAAVGWVGTVADTITSTPLLMVGCVLGFIGVGVGLFKRMFNI